MSYTKLTDFAAKDALLSGNPSKLLRGTEIGAEFDAIESAMAAAEAVNITAPIIAASTSKTTPVDADVLPILDSAAANILKKATWANIKATLKTYFDTRYAAVGSFAASGANADITGLTGLTSVPNGTVTNLPAVAGAFKNLAASANGTSANISVSADEVVLSNASNQYVTLRSVSLTIAGTSVGANALDAGTIATGTWYSVWVIWNGTTTAGLLSTSATSPTLPSGYTHKARVGWIRTDASGNKYPLAFNQKGRNVRHIVAAATNVTALPVIATGTIAWPTAAGINNFFPPTTAKAVIQFLGTNLASGYVYLGPSATLTLAFMTNSYTSGAPFSQVVEMVLESSNIYYGGSNEIRLSAYGWEDNL